MTKKNVKIIEMKVSEYVEKYNNDYPDETITRHDVYKFIKEGKLKAHKGPRGAWILEIKEIEESTYTTKEFVTEYNKKHKKAPITVVELRKYIETGKVKASKVSGKWIIKSSPSNRLK